VRSRVFRWYGRLREIENDLEMGKSDPATLLRTLDGLEAQAEKVSVPLSYADELYALRNHIHLVRKKLLRASEASGSTAHPGATGGDLPGTEA